MTVSSGLESKISDSLCNYVLKLTVPNLPQTPDLDIDWQEYKGWQNPNYNLEVKHELDINWQVLSNGISNNNRTAYIIKPATIGKYYARVYTDKALYSSRSYSNWVEFEYQPVSFKPYNIVTANGDGINDFFEIDGLSENPNTIVKIYNRWGKTVFESNNYQNNWGAKADEGVYFYFIQSPKGETKNGYIRILK
jgi:gliding motility-associated-like protein